MKRKIFSLVLSQLLLLLFVGSSWAGKLDAEKRKTVNKSYKVSNETEISFANSFGKMHVETWDKNEVSVKIEIIARANNDEKAQDILDEIQIDIDDSSPARNLSFRTDIDSKNNGRNTSFEINYNVSVPKKSKIDIKNSFGDMYVGDLSGIVRIDEQYGGLKTGRLEGETDLKLAFGSGFSEIDAFMKGEIKVSYSKLSVDQMGQVDVNSQFSTFEVEKASKLELVGKYGEIEIGEVDEIVADVNFSGFEIGKLNKSLELDIDYGGSNEIGIAPTVTNVVIENSFGPVDLEIPSGFNARVEAKMSFCDLRYDEDIVTFSKIVKDHSSAEYEGKIGNGTGAIIEITSKYGNVRID
jgi:hypothetical protein